MGSIKDLDSTAIYAYTTLISVLICVPAALFFEGPHLRAAADKAVASHPDFYFSLFLVGLLYHLYNQARATPCAMSSFSLCPCQILLFKGWGNPGVSSLSCLPVYRYSCGYKGCAEN